MCMWVIAGACQHLHHLPDTLTGLISSTPGSVRGGCEQQHFIALHSDAPCRAHLEWGVQLHVCKAEQDSHRYPSHPYCRSRPSFNTLCTHTIG